MGIDVFNLFGPNWSFPGLLGAIVIELFLIIVLMLVGIRVALR